MASKKVTIKGRGPELFGRGIDLLFGDDDNQRPYANGQPSDLYPAAEWLTSVDVLAAAVNPAREEAYLDVSDADEPAPAADYVPIDQSLQLAAEAFFSSQSTLAVIDGAAPPTALPAETTANQDVDQEAVGIISAAAAMAPLELPAAHEMSISVAQPPHEQPPAASHPLPGVPTAEQQDYEGTIMPTSTPHDLIAAGAPQYVQPPADNQARKVGVPSSNGASGADESVLPADIAKTEGTSLTRQEAKEIMSKLRRSDLSALDREVDALYDKVATLLSGNRQEATVAFDILRRVRLILLKDPEQYADAEYLVNQVRARINQIEQSLEGGRFYAPRIFAYQTVWMVVLSMLALVTTVGGGTISAWVAYFLGVSLESPQLSWAVLFMSTLAWGGIGGVTSALWSLYHHISVERDYNPVENLWYYSQPVLGMVLGGIVFLIVGAGFLVVQVDLDAQDAALGARLLPAAIAVVAGFRQNMVLDLVERIVSLIVPSRPNADSSLQPAMQQPIQQTPEELVI